MTSSALGMNQDLLTVLTMGWGTITVTTLMMLVLGVLEVYYIIITTHCFGGFSILYSPKYRQELNLAVGPEIIIIIECWWILIWRFGKRSPIHTHTSMVASVECQTTKNFQLHVYTIIQYVIYIVEDQRVLSKS